MRTISIRRPSGIIAGLTAAWAIFGLFLAVDSQLGVPPGTFYKTVGIAFGVDSAYAMYVGFILFMVTAIIISIIYNYISKRSNNIVSDSDSGLDMDEDSFDNVVYNNTIINISDPSEALHLRDGASEQNMLYSNTLINLNGERIMLDGNQE
jgi:hypothetical protein